jgi:hypothetical protein
MVAPTAPVVSHLLFADDSLLFSKQIGIMLRRSSMCYEFIVGHRDTKYMWISHPFIVQKA